MENWRSLALVRDFLRVEFIIVLEKQIKVIQLQGSDNIAPTLPTLKTTIWQHKYEQTRITAIISNAQSLGLFALPVLRSS